MLLTCFLEEFVMVLFVLSLYVTVMCFYIWGTVQYVYNLDRLVDSLNSEILNERKRREIAEEALRNAPVTLPKYIYYVSDRRHLEKHDLIGYFMFEGNKYPLTVVGLRDYTYMSWHDNDRYKKDGGEYYVMMWQDIEYGRFYENYDDAVKRQNALLEAKKIIDGK